MKFIRPLMEIEAMPMRDADGNVVSYCCDFGGGVATKILTAEDLAAQGFRLLNGHDPSKPLKKRKKTNYRSSGEAPDLSGEEPPELPNPANLENDMQVYAENGVFIHESPPLTKEQLYERLLKVQWPTEEQQEGLRILAAELGKVEPAQEYDHQ